MQNFFSSMNFNLKTETTLNLKKLHNLMQHSQVMSINRVARNQNFTYFAVGFSVISLTKDKLMLEIRLESMQKT